MTREFCTLYDISEQSKICSNIYFQVFIYTSYTYWFVTVLLCSKNTYSITLMNMKIRGNFPIARLFCFMKPGFNEKLSNLFYEYEEEIRKKNKDSTWSNKHSQTFPKFHPPPPYLQLITSGNRDVFVLRYFSAIE